MDSWDGGAKFGDETCNISRKCNFEIYKATESSAELSLVTEIGRWTLKEVKPVLLWGGWCRWTVSLKPDWILRINGADWRDCSQSAVSNLSQAWLFVSLQLWLSNNISHHQEEWMPRKRPCFDDLHDLDCMWRHLIMLRRLLLMRVSNLIS